MDKSAFSAGQRVEVLVGCNGSSGWRGGYVERVRDDERVDVRTDSGGCFRGCHPSSVRAIVFDPEAA